ncbi:MAG: phosphatidylserine decarboxylase [Synergistota bacterium]|nr:phosphatidylserine decarboxylase [Synergistota bacterium]
MRIAPDGRRAIAVLAAATLAALVFLPPWMAFVPLVATGFFVWFYRDPERSADGGETAWVSPADGRVVDVFETEHPFTGKCRVVSIFMSPLDVHVNRMPASGEVAHLQYVPGRKMMAFEPKASEYNERFYMGFETPQGRGMTLQIAGFLARRIVCRVKKGDELARSERFGMIQLGSKVDVYLPEGIEPVVRTKDRVMAGVTVIGDVNDT